MISDRDFPIVYRRAVNLREGDEIRAPFTDSLDTADRRVTVKDVSYGMSTLAWANGSYTIVTVTCTQSFTFNQGCPSTRLISIKFFQDDLIPLIKSSTF